MKDGNYAVFIYNTSTTTKWITVLRNYDILSRRGDFMAIKEILELSVDTEIEDKFIIKAKDIQQELSNQDKRKLLSLISKFKEQDIKETIKYIKILAIWEPDNAILVARKKGVFRYKANNFEMNSVLYALNELLRNSDLFGFSLETKKYLKSKISLSWIYDFYKDSERKLKNLINERHNNRIKRIVNNFITFESALFKDLLAYIDLTFSLNRESTHFDKNRINGYSKEEISDAISYIIFLYDCEIGIKSDKYYIVDTEYILGDSIEELILIAAKVIELNEWEVTMDYFNYQIKTSGNCEVAEKVYKK